MSDVIKLLPDSVANQIAAGEVIQRPASVVKELVENAVDAGATSIQIIIKDAGRTLIQVVDNGCGMSATDARLAFERHSTSKITQAADLFSLQTMGFRGEALASIAAIAQVDLRTMRRDDSIGTRLIISGSKVESQGPEACVPGSNMMVKNLFFNVPARRKFLKKDSVELSNIIHEFERLALVNIGVELTLIHNDEILYKLLSTSLKQRIVDLFGKGLERQLIPVETETSIVKLNGFVGLPENARRRNALQYFFVNGRNMRHPYFHKAVMQCYEQLISSEVQPNYFLNFTVEPATIDVNIHPTKNEIKFENESAIWQIMVAAINESLGKYNVVPAIDFDAVDVPDIPVFNPNINARHDVELDTNYNPFRDNVYSDGFTKGEQRSKSNISSVNKDWQKLYDGFLQETISDINVGSRMNVAAMDGELVNNTTIFDDVPTECNTTTLQLKNKYILSPAKSGLIIIDQHRAHVKVLYEKYIELAEVGNLASQQSMFPEILNLSSAQNAIMEDLINDINSLGFELSYLGDRAWSINGIPAVLNNCNPIDVVQRLIDDVANGVDDLKNTLVEKVALSMANVSAIKSGQQLTQLEMEQLINDLFKLSTPNFTPEGLPIVSILSMDEIAKHFSR